MARLLDPPVIIAVGDRIRLSPSVQFRGLGNVMTVRAVKWVDFDGVDLFCDDGRFGHRGSVSIDWDEFAPGGDYEILRAPRVVDPGLALGMTFADAE